MDCTTAGPPLSPTLRSNAQGWGIVRWLMTAALICAVLGWASHAVAQQFPPGFSESIIFNNLSEPTAVAFAPDGRVFVAEKAGLIKVFDNLSNPAPTVFADPRTPEPEEHSFSVSPNRFFIIIKNCDLFNS